MSTFGDFDFAVGSVRGIRQWELLRAFDPPETEFPLGVLRGSKGHYWRSAVCEAECDKTYHPHAEEVLRDDCFCGVCVFIRSVSHNIAEIPSSRCHCGVYAYWHHALLNSNDNISHGPVMGVVEATGRTILGTKGFRTQHAEILALCVQRAVPRVLDYAYESTKRQFAHTAENLANYLQEKYQVPTFISPDEMLEEFPVSSEYYNGT